MAQKWYHKAGVQAAIVAGLFFLVICIIQILHQRSGLKHQVDSLNEDITRKETDIRRLSQTVTDKQAAIAGLVAEVQRLETVLTPFRTMAVEHFVESGETEALRKLAEYVTTLEARLNKAMVELEQTRSSVSAKALKEVANIRPNGEQVVFVGGTRWTPGSISSETPSIISNRLSRAWEAAQTNDMSQCVQLLTEITRELPEWPYAYYYLGVLTHDIAFHEEAARRFAAIRLAGVEEPELLFVEALNLTFLREIEAAGKLLHGAEAKSQVMSLIPIIDYAPITPAPLAERIGVLTDLNAKKADALSEMR